MTTAAKGTAPHDTPTRVQWDSTEFYWARLDAPTRRPSTRAGVVPAAGLPQLADQLPVPIEDVHAVCVPVAGDDASAGAGAHLVVCAAVRDRIERLEPGAVSLTPRTIPPELGADGLDPSVFNLLIGEHEPAAARRARTRRRVAFTAWVCVLAALVAVGSIRRTRHAELVRLEARRSTTALLASLGMPGATLADLHAARSRLSTFARLAHAGTLSPGKGRTRDAAADLQQVLPSWPPASDAKLQSIGIGPEGAQLSILVPGDASAFVRSVRVPRGWKLDEPSFAAVGPQMRINLRMRPAMLPAGTEGGAP